MIVDLETIEKTALIADSVEHTTWTFGGSVPGEFIRVRKGDLVEFPLRNAANSTMPHNISCSAVESIHRPHPRLPLRGELTSGVMQTISEINPEWSVNELLLRHPETARVLNERGVDTCCGGGDSLAEAARAGDGDLDALLGALAAAVRERGT